MATIIRNPVVFPRKENPYWPLPPDYPTLSVEGQRRARVNAACLQQDPDHAVYAWQFFTRYYLLPDDSTGFDPMFYKPPLYATGPLHVHLVRSWEADDLSAWACPRGSGKSTTARSFILHKLTTNTQWECNLFKLKDDFVMEDVQRIREQLEFNPRIREDFGSQRAERGQGIWSNHMLQTSQRCWLRGFGVTSGKRGPRANFNLCDDMEQDPTKSTLTMEKLLELRGMIERVLIPMLDEGNKMSVIGTFVHMRSFLYFLVGPPDKGETREARWGDDVWSKHLIPWKDKEGRNAWPAKFTASFMAKKEKQMSRRAIASEYENLPLSDEECVFDILPDQHEYEVNGLVDLEEPFAQTDATVSYHECSGLSNIQVTPRTRPWNEWVSDMQRFLTVDYAYTQGSESDWSVIHVFGLDSRNDLWSLDIWKGKLPFAALTPLIWQYGMRWKCSFVGVEAYPVQQDYVNQVEAFGDQLQINGDYPPSLFPIQPPPGMDKGQKIARLTFRFEKGKVKFPRHRRDEPGYAALYFQILHFTESLGNLKKDDEIDTLGMTCDVLRGGRSVPREKTAESVEELLAIGERFYPGTDIPLVLGLNMRSIDEQTLARIRSVQRDERVSEWLDGTFGRHTDA